MLPSVEFGTSKFAAYVHMSLSRNVVLIPSFRSVHSALWQGRSAYPRRQAGLLALRSSAASDRVRRLRRLAHARRLHGRANVGGHVDAVLHLASGRDYHRGLCHQARGVAGHQAVWLDAHARIHMDMADLVHLYNPGLYRMDVASWDRAGQYVQFLRRSPRIGVFLCFDWYQLCRLYRA